MIFEGHRTGAGTKSDDRRTRGGTKDSEQEVEVITKTLETPSADGSRERVIQLVSLGPITVLGVD